MQVGHILYSSFHLINYCFATVSPGKQAEEYIGILKSHFVVGWMYLEKCFIGISKSSLFCFLYNIYIFLCETLCFHHLSGNKAMIIIKQEVCL